ncbi:conserved protein, unknown function [Plasmodium knowlesi strain H]|uniref:RWD domain-containing protein n=3 Tax=Plasmodium knowlesi TaxID=5850 RepID=A0A5K1UXY6_PLAKH|nr:RWD domain-containing protein, putative [Plasmodium knowlesi strain H]OTN64760.1 Uncharacterized protein PKNOH_S130181700 [Plasmodium knowlesi]CAA9988985.1 RWD domain-containing protein, putative [Plasmodium knowlesi strain H]SBO24829.1 conserved protein, unknown function [Plasmodium knowlesi strain H]SBO28092.1 conserved protein, unknown function [Plasmodium knowlesi strain H]VVS78459.1 RWD domain-containing protein, putative [Plasmodium knowlesi strain H]|eukprot:XP_002261333.1 hypothetical protein, conserved [Plasmodium knowlesi strain H]
MLHNGKKNPTQAVDDGNPRKSKHREVGSHCKGLDKKENINKSGEEHIKKVEGRENCEPHDIKRRGEIDKVLIQCEELQRKELEALKLIYVRDRELVIQNENDEKRDTIIHMQLNDENISDNVINLTFELPKDYPLKSFLLIDINVKNFTPDMNNYLNQEVYKDMPNYIAHENSILSIIYRINELVENIQNSKKTSVDHSYLSSEEREEYVEEGAFDPSEDQLIKDHVPFLYCSGMTYSHHRRVLARRLCYSHHILSLVKRTYIIKWAKDLKIGGYSKIGYPGIIICEGPKEEVDFYINSLNKLRWKHFDCRGMEDIILKEYEDLDDARVLPRTMYELDPKGMSTLSNICTECGLRDLFLTSMKIYHTGDKRSTDETGKGTDSNSQDKNKKKKKKK